MDTLTLLGAGIVALGVFSGYLITQLPKIYKLKWLLIPLVMFLCLSFALQVPAVLGYAKKGYPTQEFKLLAFKLSMIDSAPVIEAWLVEKGHSRLYQFPYSKEVADALASLAEQGSEGRGKFHRSGKSGNGQGETEELTTVAIPAEPLPHKDAPK